MMNEEVADEHRYDDIINIQWPQPSKRARMGAGQRAKIFLPFAALKGYEESLENQRADSQDKAENSRPHGLSWNESGVYLD